MSNKNKLINQTCSLSPNVIDWIRSIYFSLFGSSMLTFALKWSSLEMNSMISFLIGIFCFLIGLLMSLIIANRFKNFEKIYDTKPEEYRLKNTIKDYYFEKETENYILSNIIHTLFFIIWLPAIISVGYAGLVIESKSSKSSELLKEKVFHIESLSILNNNFKNLELENDTLSLKIKKIKKENDSLKSELKDLMLNIKK